MGPCGKLPILIRDDDTNFFTKNAMLQSIYTEAWNKKFKVSLSVIPSQKGTDDMCVPPDFRKTGALYPITSNEELVKILKERLRMGEIEILQHGFSHSVVRGYRGEFGVNTPDQEVILHNGIAIMRETFGIRPTFFVPPYDDISYKNLQLVKKYGLSPIYGKEKIHRFFRSPFIPTFLKKKAAKKIYLKFGRSTYIVPVAVDIASNCLYNDSRNTSNKANAGSRDGADLRVAETEVINTLPPVGLPFEKLISSDSFLDSISKIISLARFNRSRISSLCIINHYHQYFHDWSQSITRTEMFNTWQKLLSYLAGDVTYDGDHYLDFGWRTTFSELCNRVLKIQRTITTSKTGSKIVIQSISENEKIDDFSLFVSQGGVERLNAFDDVTFEKETNIITVKEVLPRSKYTIYTKE